MSQRLAASELWAEAVHLSACGGFQPLRSQRIGDLGNRIVRRRGEARQALALASETA